MRRTRSHIHGGNVRLKRATGLALGAVALGLAGAAALYNRAKTKAAEQRHPPIGRFIEVDGVRLHYLDRGQGSLVVLLHGNGALIQDMTSSGLVERLTASHRVIVFDRPGFGYSERPRSRLWSPAAQARLIGQALIRLGVESAVVYGHSLGTLVALHLGLEHRELVRKLVLGSGFYYPTPRLDAALLSLPAIPGPGDLMRHTVSPFLTEALLPAFYDRLFAPSPVTQRFRRDFPHDLLRRPSHIRAAAADTAYMIPAAERLEHRYGDLAMPVTIVAGQDDRIVAVDAHSVRLSHDVPGSRLIVVPGAGHMIHHVDLEAVLAAIEHEGTPAAA